MIGLSGPLSSGAVAQETIRNLLEDLEASPASPEALPKEEGQGTAPQKTRQFDLKDIPDEVLEEAETFMNYCRNTSHMMEHYDCRCLAVSYLDKRMELGPEADRSVIIFSISRECPDAAGAAGMHFQRCMRTPSLMPEGINLEEFCTCMANTYADLYGRYKTGPGSNAFVNIQSQAMTMCRNPELARRLYPFLPPR